MEWLMLIFGIVLLFLEFGLEFLFYSNTKKEEKESEFIARTHAPIRRIVISMIFTLLPIILFIVVVIVVMINDEKVDLGFWIALSLSCLFFFSIPFALLLIAFCDYEIIKEDGILVHRVFHKGFIKYNEIKYYQFSFEQLIAYDHNDNMILIVADMRVGVKAIIKELEKQGIRRKD